MTAPANMRPEVRHSVAEWRRLTSRAAETGAGIEVAWWNAGPGLIGRGYVLELVELGIRAVDYLNGLCADCWRVLPASGVCVPGCRRVARYGSRPTL